MNVAARSEHSLDFRHHALRRLYVFEHRVAFHSLKKIPRKRHLLRVRRYIDARRAQNIQVYVARRPPPRASNVQIPPAQREIAGFARIVDQRKGGFQESDQQRLFTISSTSAGTTSNRSPTMP